jgi:hypothetical protein
MKLQRQFNITRNIQFILNIEPDCLAFTRWYISECGRQGVPCDGKAYNLTDAYADYVESLR